MRPRRWFLPETPDVLGLLHHQLEVTIESVDAFAAWANGDAGAAEAVRDAGPAGDTAKRELLSALRHRVGPEADQPHIVVPLERVGDGLQRGVDRATDVGLGQPTLVGDRGD